MKKNLHFCSVCTIIWLELLYFSAIPLAVKPNIWRCLNGLQNEEFYGWGMAEN